MIAFPAAPRVIGVHCSDSLVGRSWLRDRPEQAALAQMSVFRIPPDESEDESSANQNLAGGNAPPAVRSDAASDVVREDRPETDERRLASRVVCAGVVDHLACGVADGMG